MRFVPHDHRSVSDLFGNGDGHRHLYISGDYGKTLLQIELAAAKYTRVKIRESLLKRRGIIFI